MTNQQINIVKILFLLTFLAVALYAWPVFAQDGEAGPPETVTESTTDVPPGAPTADDAEAAAVVEPELKTAVSANPPMAPSPLETRVAQQDEEISELRDALAAVSDRVDAAEAAAEAAEMDAAQDAFAPKLDIYGFLSTFFAKTWVPEDSPLEGVMLTKSYFAVTDLNLYLSAHLSETFSALVELGFTFMPQGSETGLLPEYDRVDNTVMDLRTSKDITLGGVFIERAQVTWQPRDWFGLTVGRYLTPYGIWNIDHGAPVVLTPRLPYLVLRQAMPLAQTGLQAHGRLFPKDSIYFDYAVTLSNGRGSTESVYDLNENKGMGLRLKFGYSTADMEIALGGYGYYGTVNDVTKTFNLAATSFGIQQTEKYSELAGALDILLRYKGLRLQSEYVRTLTKYDIRPVRQIPEVGIELPGQYQPDYIQWDLYILLAYEIAFSGKAKGMTLTPWVMMERSVYDDTYSDTDLFMYTAGFTFRPRHFVSFKLGGLLLNFPDSTILEGNNWGIQSQLAAAF